MPAKKSAKGVADAEAGSEVSYTLPTGRNAGRERKAVITSVVTTRADGSKIPEGWIAQNKMAVLEVELAGTDDPADVPTTVTAPYKETDADGKAPWGSYRFA